MTLEEIIADPEKARARIADLETALVLVTVLEPHPGPATVLPQFNAAPTPPTSARRVTLTPEEREMARLLFPKTSPNDPDPEVVYARRKLELEDKRTRIHHLDGDPTNNSPENLRIVQNVP